jgi:flagellar hook assembly protein FlgD
MVFDANVLLPMTGQKLTITYVPPSTGDVEIHIYNISGNVIRYLYPGTATADTPNVTTWDGTDRNGQVVASGVYFVEIKAPGFHLVKKVAVVK